MMEHVKSFFIGFLFLVVVGLLAEFTHPFVLAAPFFLFPIECLIWILGINLREAYNILKNWYNSRD